MPTEQFGIPHIGSPDAYDAIVLGAGISGLVSASILLAQGCSRVLVVDEYPSVGGNHINRTIGKFTFDIGSFIFQDDSPLLAHFPEILPYYVPITPTWGRLNPHGLVTRYPISVKDDLIAAGPLEWFRILGSVLLARTFHRRLENAGDFARYWIGARLLRRSGLENYMERFYSVPPEKIDIKFAESRMEWIRNHASLPRILKRLLPVRNKSAPNRQLARPKEGFACLYQKAVERLERGGTTFLLGTKMLGLRKQDGIFFLDTEEGRASSARVVSTVPLDRIRGLIDLRVNWELSTVTLISLFFSFSGTRGFAYSILYNFSDKGAWKRLTMHSDFYGKTEGREYFSVEVNANRVADSVESAERDFRDHVSQNGLFAGDLKLEGSHILSNAYPIYTEHADERAASVIGALRKLGIESIGRQGGFDYQPTARVTTLKAEAALAPGS